MFLLLDDILRELQRKLSNTQAVCASWKQMMMTFYRQIIKRLLWKGAAEGPLTFNVLTSIVYSFLFFCCFSNWRIKRAETQQKRVTSGCPVWRENTKCLLKSNQFKRLFSFSCGISIVVAAQLANTLCTSRLWPAVSHYLPPPAQMYSCHIYQPPKSTTLILASVCVSVTHTSPHPRSSNCDQLGNFRRLK